MANLKNVNRITWDNVDYMVFLNEERGVEKQIELTPMLTKNGATTSRNAPIG